MLEKLERLFDHIEWANRRALDALGRAPHDDARELLAHVLATEEVWLARIRTGSSDDLEIWPDLSLEECEALMAENLDGYRALLHSRSVDELRDTVSYRNSRGTPFDTPVVDILLHVALHGSHHRGQIAREIRASGSEPVNTDYMTFVRETP